MVQNQRAGCPNVCSPERTGPHRDSVWFDPGNAVLVNGDAAHHGQNAVSPHPFSMINGKPSLLPLKLCQNPHLELKLPNLP